MIRIELVNIQSIEEAVFEIEEKSITEFVGNNSNGKSILSKVIQAVTSGDIRHKEVRQALIKDGQPYGLFGITYKTQQIVFSFYEELKDCLVVYVPNTANPDKNIVRQLSDREGIESILHKFGFRTYAKGDICLQLSPTFGAIPFITTSGAVNGEIVQDITTDKVAQEFLDSFKDITFPIFRNKLSAAKKEKESLETVIAAAGSYDWRVFEDIAKESDKILNMLEGYKFIRINELPIPPLGFKIRATPHLRELPFPINIAKAPRVGFLESELNNLEAILNDKCPTCGRAFIQQGDL